MKNNFSFFASVELYRPNHELNSHEVFFYVQLFVRQKVRFSSEYY